MGRIDSSDVFEGDKAHWPSGYVLRLKPDGSWELLSAAYKQPVATLASGSAKLDRREWHRLALSFRGTHVEASLDGKPLTSIESTTHARGMFALGTEWDRVQFDNLRVER